jgi:hypothetical protein
MTISVVAVHQRHLADIAGGYAVSLMSIFIIKQQVFTKTSLQ